MDEFNRSGRIPTIHCAELCWWEFYQRANSTISYNLSLGSNVFYVFAFGDLPLSYPEASTFGLNLFINDVASLFTATPELSGTTAANYGSGANFSSTSL